MPSPKKEQASQLAQIVVTQYTPASVITTPSVTESDQARSRDACFAAGCVLTVPDRNLDTTPGNRGRKGSL